MNESQKSELLKIANDKMLMAALSSYFQDRFSTLTDRLLKPEVEVSNELLGQTVRAITQAKTEVEKALEDIKNLGKGREVLKDNVNPAR